MKKRKFTKFLVILIAVAMLLPTMLATAALFKNKGSRVLAEQKGEPQKTLQQNLGGDYTDKLKAEGYTEHKILEAKMLVERIVFQLDEIVGQDWQKSIITDDSQDLSSFSELLAKIDTERAVYYMLILEKDFGSMEKVLDEYLVAIQLELDLEMYSKDKESYEKAKSDKLKVSSKSIITAADIEAKMLEKIQSDNLQRKQNIGTTPQNDTSSLQQPDTVDVPDIKPSDPLQDIKNIGPEDPLKNIMNEIDSIKNKSLFD